MSTRLIHDPPVPHRCRTGRPDGLLVGAIKVCDDCGEVWVLRKGEPHEYWSPLRLWPFDRRARALVRKAFSEGGA